MEGEIQKARNKKYEQGETGEPGFASSTKSTIMPPKLVSEEPKNLLCYIKLPPLWLRLPSAVLLPLACKRKLTLSACL